MKLIKVNNLKSKVLPKHERVYAKEIWGKESGAKNCVVLYNEMDKTGGAEMHVHADSEHIFYVIEGEMSITDGNETYIIKAGEAAVVEPGEPHEAKGTGKVNCKYLLATSPPATFTDK